MSADKYRFVSPGVFITEVDQSQVPALGTNDDGPIIIGRATQGPSYKPTRVHSYSEFVQIFGDTVAGGQAGDVWRNGNFTTPMYGTYAAKAYLANNNPITYVRLLGSQDADASSTDPAAGAAGWGVGNLAGDGQNGAYGLFVTPDPDDTAAAFTIIASSSATNGQAMTIIATDGTSATFTLHATNQDADEFARNGSSTYSLTELSQSIAASDLNHKVTISAVTSDGSLKLMTITQATAGPAGMTVVTNNLGTYSINAGTAGTSGKFAGDAAGGAAEGSLAAIFYCKGAAPVLSGSTPSGSTRLSNGAILKQVASGPEFKIAISGSNSKNQIKTFNFTPNSSKFIRKVFNTNPVKTNTYTQTSTSKESYWLGETYEKEIAKLGTSNCQAVILGLVSGAAQLGDFYGLSTADKGPQASATGWFIAQDTNTPSSDFNPTSSVTQLFKLHGLTANGAETQNRVKVTIRNIRFPSSQEQSVNPYPSFTVQLRHLRDTDLRQNVLETFNNCNLNPNSQNYICRLVGDKYEQYNTTTGRLDEHGDYDNLSKYVRVEVNGDIKAGQETPSLAPFGVLGPLKFKSVVVTSGSAVPVNAATAVTASGIYSAGGIVQGTTGSNNILMTGTPTLTLKFPTISLIASSSDMGFNKHRDAYFGVNLLTEGSKNRFEESTLDLLRAKPGDIDSFTNGNVTDHQYAFTLDNIVLSGAGGNAYNNTVGEFTEAWHEAGARGVADSTRTSYTALSGAAALVNDRRINKFTTVMFGGNDGLDITEGDPFRNTILDDSNGSGGDTTDLTNYARASITRAINIISDAETTTYDLATMPGITVPALTNKLIETCEERGDALAVIDVENDYIPVHEGDGSSTYPILPNVTTAVASMRSRTTDSSYGCAFYPWVQTRDVPSGQMLWVPPSVVGMGTLGSSAAKSELWFAPAGFNRGGLSKGAGGLTVTNVRTKLTSQQRDDLYDVRINPIASFPTEGIVVFGQKTMQLQRSALDRINVRRLMIFLKKKISQVANSLLFDQNVQSTWDRFKGMAEPLLADVQAKFGLEEYKLVLDTSTTTADLRDRNVMYAKVFLKPAKSIEFIAIDFFITNSGASFED
tara:strand:+ start:381 stop:3662 length:3282 start_codon:yes stop_codon:yes gene_type:complete